MKKTIISITFIFLILLGVWTIYRLLNHTYIKAEFKNIDPLPDKMDVFYKGYKLGKTSKLKISNDFTTTYLYITLNQRGLHLPKNITVEIKNYDKETKYVDIIYPNAPQIKYIKSGDIIKGKNSVSLNGISDINQAHLDNLSEKGENLLESARNATDSLSDMFELITDILDENRLNIYQITTNLKNSTYSINKTSTELEQVTSKLNTALTQKSIKNSVKNIETVTKNTAISSSHLNTISSNLIQTTNSSNELINNTNSLIDILKLTVCNLNSILESVKNTLSKKFGGARLLLKQKIN